MKKAISLLCVLAMLLGVLCVGGVTAFAASTQTLLPDSASDFTIVPGWNTGTETVQVSAVDEGYSFTDADYGFPAAEYHMDRSQWVPMNIYEDDYLSWDFSIPQNSSLGATIVVYFGGQNTTVNCPAGYAQVINYYIDPLYNTLESNNWSDLPRGDYCGSIMSEQMGVSEDLIDENGTFYISGIKVWVGEEVTVRDLSVKQDTYIEPTVWYEQSETSSHHADGMNLMKCYGVVNEQYTTVSENDGAVTVTATSDEYSGALALQPEYEGVDVSTQNGRAFMHVVLESDVPFTMAWQDHNASRNPWIRDFWIALTNECYNFLLPEGFEYEGDYVTRDEALVDGRYCRPGKYDVYLPIGSLYEFYANVDNLEIDPQNANVTSVGIDMIGKGTLTVYEMALTADSGDADDDEEQPDVLLGDLNGDNQVDMRDAFALYISVSGGAPLTDAQKLAADMNGDGAFDMRDAFALYKIASGG